MVDFDPESELSESELVDPFAPLDSLDLLHLPEEETQNIAILAVLLVLGKHDPLLTPLYLTQSSLLYILSYLTLSIVQNYTWYF